jgi:hypothetical protein
MDLLAEQFASIIVAGGNPPKRGRPPIGEKAMTNAERMPRKEFMQKRKARFKHLAVLDMETDPFTDSEGQTIKPFCAEIYSDQFGAIVIWENDAEILIEKLVAAIEALPDSYTIYAHNGGKFDFMFFVHKMRGTVRFKGRGIMVAKIGNHELRDSLHILPEKLAAWKKDAFDYSKMLSRNRHKFRDEILKYLHSDCVYLFDFIKRFVGEFGLKISIGQAAFTELKKHYKIAPVKEKMDAALRPYFFGGRVECIAGMGVFESFHWQEPFKLYDVNSMYPHVMAKFKHPISPDYIWRRGVPDENTCFLDISCRSYGAMFRRLDNGELAVGDCEGRFQTTIWEYEAAIELELIDKVTIHWCIDNLQRTDFSKFIVPMYDRRQETKAIMDRLKRAGQLECSEYEETKKEGIFLKYLLNNSYGKCAQNPRRYKEYYYTNHNQSPSREWFDFLRDLPGDHEWHHEYGMPVERCEEFDVWARPSPGNRYNNVGTAASITGAARGMLLRAREVADDPIYCDTDSLICRKLPLPISETELGAWKIEETFDRVIIAGKKEYCCEVAGEPDCGERRLKVRCKGIDIRDRPRDRDGIEKPNASPDEWRIANARTWQKFVDIIDGKIIEAINRAPTFTKLGEQKFMRRRIRATAPLLTRKPQTRLHDGTARIQNRR